MKKTENFRLHEGRILYKGAIIYQQNQNSGLSFF